jgi:methylglyoxal reductase
MRASVVGLGTWAIGGGSVWGSEPDDSQSVRAIQAAIDAGVNLIDTAPAYGFGRSERLVGQAIRGRRDQVLLATKCGLWWEDRRGSFFGPFDGKRLFRSLRPETLQIELDNSLRRLSVNTIDLYQVHWPAIEPDKTPIGETMACLQQFVQQGKIRAIGVSNVSPDELREYVARGAVSCQSRYNLLWRQVERDILPLCTELGVGFLAWSTLEQALLTGHVGVDRAFQPKEYRSNYDWNPWFRPDNRRRVLALLEGWQDLARKYRCTLAQLVIAWTVSRPEVTVALCGARRPEQAVENAGGADIDLEAADLRRIEADVDALGGS